MATTTVNFQQDGSDYISDIIIAQSNTLAFRIKVDKPVPGNISSNYTMVNLGFDGSNQFAESATKLAGIYSSTLSKDDCIKAYNYLQTLKAK